MKLILLLVLLCLLKLINCEDPDVNRNGPELISSKGLPVETHYVTTSDSFILEMIRIPRLNSPVVFLQHGLLDSADTWLLNGRTSSLAYMFYDAGFDVWLGNSRGNKYSTNSTKYSPNNDDFWDWTFYEMAQYDLPAQIDYALAEANREKLVYVGHSQGCAQLLINAQTGEGWNRKEQISLAILLAPAARVYHTTSLLLKTIGDLDFDKIVGFFDHKSFLPTSKFLRWLLPTVCDVTPLLCDSVIYLLAGLDLGDLDQNRMDVYTAHFPSGTSVKDMEQWAQLVRHDRFSRFDYGAIENEIKYGQLTPPNYQLNNIEAPPLAVWYGGQDDLADSTDVKIALSQIPDDDIVHQQEIAAYGHLDFVWGAHANTTVYRDVITFAKQYS